MARSKRCDRVANAVKSELSNLVHFKLTHKQWLDNRSKLYDSPDWKKATIAEKEYWRGYQVAFIDRLYMTDLKWCHMGQDGIYYTCDQFRAKYGESCYDRAVNPWFDIDKSAHVWNGSQKPFNISNELFAKLPKEWK